MSYYKQPRIEAIMILFITRAEAFLDTLQLADNATYKQFLTTVPSDPQYQPLNTQTARDALVSDIQTLVDNNGLYSFDQTHGQWGLSTDLYDLVHAPAQSTNSTIPKRARVYFNDPRNAHYRVYTLFDTRFVTSVEKLNEDAVNLYKQLLFSNVPFDVEKYFTDAGL